MHITCLEQSPVQGKTLNKTAIYYLLLISQSESEQSLSYGQARSWETKSSQ